MPRPSRLKLPALKLGKESCGRRIARLRKSKGYTQVQLAEKMGITQGLVSAYERDALGMRADMVVRFARALRISADELLGLKSSRDNHHEPSLRIRRRLNRIESLPRSQQDAILKTLDALLKATER